MAKSPADVGLLAPDARPRAQAEGGAGVAAVSEDDVLFADEVGRRAAPLLVLALLTC